MLLALLVLALIALVLATPIILREASRWRDRRAARRRPTDPLEIPLYDPGRDRRAEQRARELLRSCVNDEEWAMYRDLGFIRVGGRHRRPASDDVLAKWMALTSDEDRVIRRANMHLVGRQLDPARVRRDLWRLAEWERRRARRGDGEHSGAPGPGGPKRAARPGPDSSRSQ
jgi:hypothetical protein